MQDDELAFPELTNSDLVRAAADKLVQGLAGVRTFDQLWSLYRSAALPAEAPLLQVAETRRTLLWAVAAMSSIAADPVRFGEFLTDTRNTARRTLQRNSL